MTLGMSKGSIRLIQKKRSGLRNLFCQCWISALYSPPLLPGTKIQLVFQPISKLQGGCAHLLIYTLSFLNSMYETHPKKEIEQVVKILEDQP